MWKVLVVEDEDIIRKSLVHTIDWLAMECSVVGEAANGVQGLDRIAELKPHIVITDIRMPGMSGIEMLQQAHAKAEKPKGVFENAPQRVPFESIILTGFSDFEYARQAITLNVSDYILKPIDEDKLCEAVCKAAKAVEVKAMYNEFSQIAKDKGSLELVNMEVYTEKKRVNPHVRAVLLRIQEAYNEKLSVDDLATELGVSPSYLHRKIRQETGLTFLHLLHQYRVQKAVALMESSELRIYEISYTVGFSDYKHFCSVFKKCTGAAPTEFIKSQSYVKKI